VEAAAAQQRAQLLAGPRRLEVAPDDRVKARIPVPLVPVTRRRRAREAVRSAVREMAFAPVPGEHAVSLVAQARDPGGVDRGPAGANRSRYGQSRFRSASSASNTRSQLIDVPSAAAATGSGGASSARSIARARSTGSLGTNVCTSGAASVAAG